MTNHELTESEILWNEARDSFRKMTKKELLATIKDKIVRDGHELILTFKRLGKHQGRALEYYNGKTTRFLFLIQKSIYVYFNQAVYSNLNYDTKNHICEVMKQFGVYPQFNYAEERIPAKIITIKKRPNLEAFEYQDQLPAVVIEVPISDLIDVDKADTDFMDEVAQDFVAELPHVLCKGQIIGVAEFDISLKHELVVFDIRANFLGGDDLKDAFRRLDRKDVTFGTVIYHPRNDGRIQASTVIHFTELRKRREEGF